MQAEYLKRRFEIKDDLHRLISGIELSRSLKTEEKEVKDGVNQLEVKGYDKQTFSVEYNVSGQWSSAPYIEYMEWRRLKGKKGLFLLGSEQLGSGDFCMVGGTDDEGKFACWDLCLLANTILRNQWSKINRLSFGLIFTLLEKV